MKKLLLILFFILLFPLWSFAETYYVKADGNDSLDGKSDAQAWKTIDKVNDFNFSTGDDVYLKCDDTWTSKRLFVDWSGTTEDRAIVGAYYGSGTIGVSGNKPVFDGNDDTPNATRWDAIVQVNQSDYVTVTNLNIISAEGQAVRFNDGATYGYAINVDSSNIRNAALQWNNGSTYGLAEGCVSTTAGMGFYEGIDPDRPAAICMVVNSDYGTIKNCTIYNVHAEGIGFYQKSDNCTAEYNVVYNAWSAGIYIDGGRDCIVRYNMVYGTTNDTFRKTAGAGIGIADEGWVGAWSRNNIIYGNLVAFYERGFVVGVTVTDAEFANSYVYNNTFVGNSIAIQLIGNSFSNSAIKNNIFYLAGGGSLYDGPTTTSGLTWDYNNWSSSVLSGQSGANDIIGNPDLAKSSGWRSLTAGSLDEADFNLTSVSPGINQGEDLGDDYDEGLSATSDLPGTPILLDRDDYGTGWEIGAIPYTGGVVVDDPTSTVIKTGWANEAAVVAGGGKFQYTLENTEWVATIGEDNEITTAFLAGITGSLSCATCWNLTVKANHDYSDVTRISATVLDIDFNAEPTYDITTNEQIDTVIPASATVSGEVINANSVQIAVVLEPPTGIQIIQDDNGAILEYGVSGKIMISE